MELKERIKTKYNKIIGMIEKYPGDEKFLDETIKLERMIGNYLYNILKNKPYGKKDPENTNVYQLYKSGGTNRSLLEKKILNNVINESISIDEILQKGLDSLNEILSTNNSTEEILKNLKINTIDLDGIILPTNQIAPNISGGGSGFEIHKMKTNKICLLISLLRELGIYTDDLLVYKGANSNNTMRMYPYYGIYVPKFDKTIFINEGYGEATFICDGEILLEKMQEIGKDGLVKEYGAEKLSFQDGNINEWKNKVHQIFCGISLKKKVNIGILKDRVILASEIRKKYQDADEEIKNIFNSAGSYGNKENQAKIKKHFGEWMPNSYWGLIPLLGGTTKYLSGDYVTALLEGKGKEWEYKMENGEFEREKAELVEGIINQYSNADEEIKNIFNSADAYENEKNQEKLKKHFGEGIPKTFKSLIRLLGGNISIQSGEYVKALMEGKGKEWEENNEKNKLTPEDVRRIYKEAPKYIKDIFISASTYENKENQIVLKKRFGNQMPDSFVGLISLLGGNTRIQRGAYVIALMISKEEGEKWEENNEKNKLTPEDVRRMYKDAPKYIKEILSGGDGVYKKNQEKLKEYFGEGMLSSLVGLISLLGGNTRIQRGAYVIALLEGKGEEWEKNWEETKEKNKITPDYVRKRYQEADEHIKNLFNGVNKYKRKENQIALKERFGEGMPGTFRGLIKLLGGNPKIQIGEYVKALIISKEEGEKWELAHKKTDN